MTGDAAEHGIVCFVIIVGIIISYITGVYAELDGAAGAKYSAHMDFAGCRCLRCHNKTVIAAVFNGAMAITGDTAHLSCLIGCRNVRKVAHSKGRFCIATGNCACVAVCYGTHIAGASKPMIHDAQIFDYAGVFFKQATLYALQPVDGVALAVKGAGESCNGIPATGADAIAGIISICKG